MVDPISIARRPESNRAACTAAEWQTRVELAALYRATAHFGMSDLANGAIAARVAGEPDFYLTHPYGLYWEEMRASDLVKIDASGAPVEPRARNDPREYSSAGLIPFLRHACTYGAETPK